MQRKPKVKSGYYSLKQELVWTVVPIIFGGGFYVGNVKFDSDKIKLSDTNRALQDTIKIRENTIKYIRHNSDSALNILGHMPYSEMKLDTQAFRKVQTTLEDAGAALYLNK